MKRENRKRGTDHAHRAGEVFELNGTRSANVSHRLIQQHDETIRAT